MPVHRHEPRLGDDTTRKLLITRVKHETFAFRSFGEQRPMSWNSLPATIHNINDVAEFKNH